MRHKKESPVGILLGGMCHPCAVFTPTVKMRAYGPLRALI